MDEQTDNASLSYAETLRISWAEDAAAWAGARVFAEWAAAPSLAPSDD